MLHGPTEAMRIRKEELKVWAIGYFKADRYYLGYMPGLRQPTALPMVWEHECKPGFYLTGMEH